jgi:SAM-dependent methyltransferase
MRSWTAPSRREAPPVFGAPPDLARRSLDELAAANRFCRGTRSVVMSVAPLVARAPAGAIRVLDVGSGGGDIARGLVQWGREAGHLLQVVAIDRNSEAVARAAARSRGFAEIQHVRGDACDLPFGPDSFDFVLASMMLHYFSLDEAARLLAGFARTAKRAVVIADIERHWFPYLAIGVLARLTGERLVRRQFPGVPSSKVSRVGSWPALPRLPGSRAGGLSDTSRTVWWLLESSGRTGESV